MPFERSDHLFLSRTQEVEMNLTGFYPVLCTQDIPEIVDYYVTYFDFQETFEGGRSRV